MKCTILAGIIGMMLMSCSNPKNIEYKEVRNVQLQKFGIDETDMKLDLVYYNPNSFGMKLKKLDADIFVDRHFLGKISMDSLMDIPRKSTFIVPSTLAVDLKGFYKNAFNLILNPEVLLEVKGTSRIGKGRFFTTIPFSYEGRHKLNLF